METLRTLPSQFTQYRVVEAMECYIEIGDDDYKAAPDEVVVIQDWKSVQGYQGLGAKLEGELLELLARQERAGDLNEGTLKVQVTNNLEKALQWTQLPTVDVARKELRDDEFWLALSVKRVWKQIDFVVDGFDKRKHHLLAFSEVGSGEKGDWPESQVVDIFEAIRAAV